MMRTVVGASELLQFDEPGAYASADDWKDRLPALWTRINVAVREISRRHRVALELEDPSSFQDGSTFTNAREYCASPTPHHGGRITLGGFSFSRYGDFFRGGRIDDRSAASLETWNVMKDTLEINFRFRYVPDDVLQSRYSGQYPQFQRMTWEERYFADFYAHLRKHAT